jgi:hypothetical protein
MDIREIVTAWAAKVHPSVEQKELANERYNICLSCPSYKEGIKNKKWSRYCGECGCPIAAKVFTKKIYSDENGSCPLGKWKEIEIQYENVLNRYAKKEKSII